MQRKQSIRCSKISILGKTMIVSEKGRSFERGKAVGLELRKSVIDMIVKEDGDVTNGNFPGSFKNVAQHLSLSLSFVRKLWKQCCDSRGITPQRQFREAIRQTWDP